MLPMLRMLGILLGMLVAVGFGLCGAAGVLAAGRGVLSGGPDPGLALFFVFGLVGLGIAAASGRAAWRALKQRPGAGAPADQ